MSGSISSLIRRVPISSLIRRASISSYYLATWTPHQVLHLGCPTRVLHLGCPFGSYTLAAPLGLTPWKPYSGVTPWMPLSGLTPWEPPSILGLAARTPMSKTMSALPIHLLIGRREGKKKLIELTISTILSQNGYGYICCCWCSCWIDEDPLYMSAIYNSLTSCL